MNATKIAAVQDVRFFIVPGPPHVQRVSQLGGVVSDVPFARSAGHCAW